MSAAATDSEPWPRHRWVVVTTLILAAQLALILWLADRQPVRVHPITLPTRVYLPPNPRIELPDVSNPALFVLSNRRGFSGEAWLQGSRPAPPSPPPPPDRPPPPLPYTVLRLGSVLTEFLHTNLAGAFDLAPKPDLQLGIISPIENAGAAPSTLTIEGDLAHRPLLSQITLSSWPATENAEILTNSVVQVGVDSDGNVCSAVLVPPAGSGSREADASALKLAKSAQFKSLRRADEGEAMQWGSLVFRWHTVTNTVAAGVAVPANH